MEEKRIEYKATRKLFLAILLISVGITWVFVIAITPFSMSEQEDIIMLVAALLLMSILMTALALAVCYINVKTYVFTKDGIEVFRGKKQIRCYERKNIKELRYVKLSPMHFARAFAFVYHVFIDSDRKGATWCLHVFTKDGRKKALFWFNKKIAEKLRTELYGKLVNIC